MEKQVLVNESSLVNIADALRGLLNETYTVEEVIGYGQKTYVSKTDNATSLTSYSGSYGDNKSVYDTIHIPGAEKIKITMAYQTESTSYDYVQVFAGTQENYVSTLTKYGGNSSSNMRVNLEFATDTVTFYFRSDNSNSNYLGYYAEVKGYLADDTPIEEPIYNTIEKQMVYTPSEMGSALSKAALKLNIYQIETKLSASSAARTIDLSSILPTGTTPFFVATAVSSGYTAGFYYNGETLAYQTFDYNMSSLVKAASYNPSTKKLSITFSGSYSDRYTTSAISGMGSLVIWPSI